MTAEADTLIGALIDIDESALKAVLTVGEGGEFPVVTIDGEEVMAGRLGSYVIISQGGIEVVAMVMRAYQERRAFRQEQRAMEFAMLDLIPLGELTRSRAFTRGVIHFPTPGAEVHVIRPSDIHILFKAYRDFGFELGYLPSHPSIGVSLHPSNLFGRHFAILGQSGAGKSWSVTSTIQRALKAMRNAHIILLDLHVEYVWKDSRGNVSSAFQEGVYRYLDARQLEIPYWLLTYSELVDLLIDRDDEGSPPRWRFCARCCSPPGARPTRI
ncbi:MAG: ATP-binding protein [Candidatus Sedimenticola endophacoides]